MGILSPRIKVAVLRGGPSPEYDVSLKTGHHVLSLLREMGDRYESLDVFISRDGEWHRDGLVAEPHEALRYVDVVWNALHGTYGEDGQVQRILESLNIPYTGSGVTASAIAINKDLAKRAFASFNLLTPQHEVFTRENYSEEKLLEVFHSYLHPVVVKPASSGSSLGITLAYDLPTLKKAVEEAFFHSSKVMIEEFIRGKEATCGVVEGLRGEKLYSLLPIEIRRPSTSIFDYEAKYSGSVEEICPGNFSEEESKMIQSCAKLAHEVLGLRHFSRSDFIVTPRGRVYILETNSLPGFTEQSLLPKALHAAGVRLHDFAHHCIELALGKV